MSSVYQSLIPSATERLSVYETLDQAGTQFTGIYEIYEWWYNHCNAQTGKLIIKCLYLII